MTVGWAGPAEQMGWCCERPLERAVNFCQIWARRTVESVEPECNCLGLSMMNSATVKKACLRYFLPKSVEPVGELKLKELSDVQRLESLVSPF